MGLLSEQSLLLSNSRIAYRAGCLPLAPYSNSLHIIGYSIPLKTTLPCTSHRTPMQGVIQHEEFTLPSSLLRNSALLLPQTRHMSETRLNLLVRLFIQEQRNGTVSQEAHCAPPHSECRRSCHFSLSRFLSLNHFWFPFTSMPEGFISGLSLPLAMTSK